MSDIPNLKEDFLARTPEEWLDLFRHLKDYHKLCRLIKMFELSEDKYMPIIRQLTNCTIFNPSGPNPQYKYQILNVLCNFDNYQWSITINNIYDDLPYHKLLYFLPPPVICILGKDNIIPAYGSFYQNGIVKVASWYKDNTMHRDSTYPTEISYYESGNVQSYRWTKRAYYLPNVIKYRDDEANTCACKYWYSDDKYEILHRKNGPAILAYTENGNLDFEIYYTAGIIKAQKVNNVLLASYVKYINGVKLLEIWHDDGEIHSYGAKPAIIKYDTQQRKTAESWYHRGQLSRGPGNHGPSLITYRQNIITKTWYVNGKIGRNMDKVNNLYLPSVIVYKNWQVIERMWYENGQLHNDKGPAYIRQYTNGFRAEVRWYSHGQISRSSGPAIILYHMQGHKTAEKWYIKGVARRKNNLPICVEYDAQEKIIGRYFTILQPETRIPYN